MTSLLYLFYQNLIRKLFLLKPIIKKPQELWHKFFQKGSITYLSVEDSCRKTNGVPLTVFVNTGEFRKKCSRSLVSTQGKEVRASVVTHQNKFNCWCGCLVATISIRFLHQHIYINFQSSWKSAHHVIPPIISHLLVRYEWSWMSTSYSCCAPR